jgi:hypothetical protein
VYRNSDHVKSKGFSYSKKSDKLILIQRLSILLLIFFVFSISTPVFAIGGLTGSKGIVLSADTVEPGSAEATMEFSLFHAHSSFNEYGHLKDHPGDYDKLEPGEKKHTISENGVAFSFTAGLPMNMEAGLSYGHITSERADNGLSFTNFDDLRMGLKYSPVNEGSIRFAILTGINIESVKWTMDGEIGGVLTVEPTGKLNGFSWDISAIYLQSTKRDIEGQQVVERGFQADTGIGLSLGIFTPAIELNYQENRSWRFRPYTLGRQVEINANLSPEEAEINVLSQLGVPDFVVPASIPVYGGSVIAPPPLEEKVQYIERKLYTTISLGMEVTEHLSLVLLYSHDLTGASTAAGQTLSGVITIGF